MELTGPLAGQSAVARLHTGLEHVSQQNWLVIFLLTVLKPKRKIDSYAIDPATLVTRPIPIDESLRDEAIAYYQTASRAFRLRKLKEPGH